MEAQRGRTSPDSTPNTCDRCGASFPSPETLERHQVLTHPDMNAPATDRSYGMPGATPEETSAGAEMRPDESEMADEAPPTGTREPTARSDPSSDDPEEWNRSRPPARRPGERRDPRGSPTIHD